ncbi:hypothetical protein chiPu_0033688, partial [Chiloscyllium punctatum]|nr:hypothetical protein [Chiloscyllium punctatum]
VLGSAVPHPHDCLMEPRSGKVRSGFPKRSCSNKELKRDDASLRSHRALDVILERQPLRRRQMQAMLGAPIQEVGRPPRPLRLAQIRRFAFIEIAAEMPAQVGQDPGRTQQFARARPVEPRIMMDKLLR